jgi:archaemetzincin
VFRVSWLGRGAADERLFPVVREELTRAFGVTTLMAPFAGWPASAYDERRRQLSSTRTLAWLAAGLPDDGSRALAFTDADLFIPILTFVFGEAQLGGRAAIVSTARLSDGDDARLVPLRLAKETSHEAGHVFGLLHCEAPRCVMMRSAALSDIDRKSGELCRDCRLRLTDLRRGGTHA